MNRTIGTQDNWNLLKKLSFRLIFAYIILYILTLFLSPILTSTLSWFATTILGYNGELKLISTGSGDRLFDYVRLVLCVLLTFLVVLVWSIVDARRKSYLLQCKLLTTIVRVVLFLTMLLYGFGKIFKGQFADHSLEKLVQTVGELSPMGLAWTFMGHSFAYNVFIGVSEILGGVLMLSKRTQTLGAISILGVMSNVFMMNMTYDIPVKLVSAHIVLLSLILIFVDKHRLISFFVKNEDTSRKHLQPTFKNPKNNAIISSVKKVILGLILTVLTIQIIVQFKIREQFKEKSELYGLWETNAFKKNDSHLPALITDSKRWQYLIIEEKRKAVVKTMTGAIERYGVAIDTIKKQITFYPKHKMDSVHQILSYKVNKDTLRLNGVFYHDTLNVSLNKKSIESFKLINQKFHWVNEKPH